MLLNNRVNQWNQWLISFSKDYINSNGNNINDDNNLIDTNTNVNDDNNESKKINFTNCNSNVDSDKDIKTNSNANNSKLIIEIVDETNYYNNF